MRWYMYCEVVHVWDDVIRVWQDIQLCGEYEI